MKESGLIFLKERERKTERDRDTVFVRERETDKQTEVQTDRQTDERDQERKRDRERKTESREGHSGTMRDGHNERLHTARGDQCVRT